MDPLDPTLIGSYSLHVGGPDKWQMNVYHSSDDDYELPPNYFEFSEPLEHAGVYSWRLAVHDDSESGYDTDVTEEGSFTVLAYSPPAIDAFSVQRYAQGVDDEGNPVYMPTDDGTHIWYNIDATVASLLGQNAWKLTRLRDDTGGARQLLSGSDGTHIIREEDHALDTEEYKATQSIGLRLTLSDRFSSVERYVVVPKAGAYFDLEKYGVAIGQRTTATPAAKRFEVAKDFESFFYGGISGVTNYVEGEVPTGGTWVDGRPIYRFVWVGKGGNTGSQTKMCSLPSVPVTVLSARGAFNRSNGVWFPIPYTYYDNLSWSVNVRITKSGEVYVGLGSTFTDPQNMLLVIEYTREQDSRIQRPVAAMTANSSQGCVASASTEYSTTYPAWKAFNKKSGTQEAWLSAADDGDPWIQLKMDVALLNISLTVTPRNKPKPQSGTAQNYFFVSGYVSGSNDGKTWTQIGSFDDWPDNPPADTFVGTIQCDNDKTAYSYVRLTATYTGGAFTYSGIGEILVEGDFDHYI